MERHGGEGEHEADSSRWSSSKDSIFRIPGLFKMRNEQAYTPYKFSIGPWHFGKTELLRTGQKLKESFLKELLGRYPDPLKKQRELEDAIKIVHGDARECYEGWDVYDQEKITEVAKKKFEDMLLLDGCFILELFRRSDEQDQKAPRCRPDPPGDSLVQLAIRFFVRNFPSYEPKQSREDLAILHLVDFVRYFWGVSPGTECPDEFESFDCRTLIPSATRLKEAGVKFQKAESRSILDVRFENGVLEIPPLLITPSTEAIFRNLIIYEQCSLLSVPRVTCYAILLDCLVDTSDDADLMSRAGILDSRLSPEETAKFLNRVRDNTFVGVFFYRQLCEDVDRYCKRTWPRWRASFIQNYFTKPWAIVSVVFATIVLFFTIMQVFYK